MHVLYKITATASLLQYLHLQRHSRMEVMETAQHQTDQGCLRNSFFRPKKVQDLKRFFCFLSDDFCTAEKSTKGTSGMIHGQYYWYPPEKYTVHLRVLAQTQQWAEAVTPLPTSLCSGRWTYLPGQSDCSCCSKVNFKPPTAFIPLFEHWLKYSCWRRKEVETPVCSVCRMTRPAGFPELTRASFW